MEALDFDFFDDYTVNLSERYEVVDVYLPES